MGYNLDPPGLKERLLQVRVTDHGESTSLNRCLTLAPLVVQGLAHMLGAGIFIVTPEIVEDIAGPATFLSYLLSGLAAGLSVTCYSDLASRYTCVGSAYVYTYFALGEFCAAIVGFFLIGELIIQAPMLALGISDNFDLFLLNDTVGSWEESVFPVFLENLDLIAVGVMVIFTIINIIGIKSVSYVNIAVAIVSITSLILFIFVALIKGSWENIVNAVDPVSGRGGFLPFGWSGVIQGAGTAFFAFVGLESVVCLAEEAVRPKIDIPKATIISFVIVMVLYTLTAFSIAFFQPWYTISGTTGIIGTLSAPDLVVPRYIITAGLLFTVFSCGLCTLTTVTRVIYSVAEDGLLFSWLAVTNKLTQVPIWNILTCGFLGAVASVVYDFETLLHMVSGGTLMVFVVTALGVMVLSQDVSGEQAGDNTEYSPLTSTTSSANKYLFILIMSIFVVSSVIFACFVSFLTQSTVIVFLEAVLGVVILVLLLLIKFKIPAMEEAPNTFKCPGKPFVPGCAVVLNLFLFFHLEVRALEQLVIYSAVGLFIYFTYGIFFSKLTAEKQRKLGEDQVGME